MWLAMSILSCRQDDVAIVPADGPLTWDTVRLSVDNFEFDTSSLDAEVLMHGSFKAITKHRRTRIEGDSCLIGTINQAHYQGRFWLLEAEYQAR
jgi:hypothetical protein